MGHADPHVTPGGIAERNHVLEGDPRGAVTVKVDRIAGTVDVKDDAFGRAAAVEDAGLVAECRRAPVDPILLWTGVGAVPIHETQVVRIDVGKVIQNGRVPELTLEGLVPWIGGIGHPCLDIGHRIGGVDLLDRDVSWAFAGVEKVDPSPVYNAPGGRTVGFRCHKRSALKADVGIAFPCEEPFSNTGLPSVGEEIRLTVAVVG